MWVLTLLPVSFFFSSPIRDLVSLPCFSDPCCWSPQCGMMQNFWMGSKPDIARYLWRAEMLELTVIDALLCGMLKGQWEECLCGNPAMAGRGLLLRRRSACRPLCLPGLFQPCYVPFASLIRRRGDLLSRCLCPF